MEGIECHFRIFVFYSMIGIDLVKVSQQRREGDD